MIPILSQISHVHVSDWNCHVKDGVLSIYQLHVSENGPAVTLSLTIKQDFSWIICYQNQPVILQHLQSVSLLQNIPSSINSGKRNYINSHRIIYCFIVSSLTNLIGALCAIKEIQINNIFPVIHDTKALQ